MIVSGRSASGIDDQIYPIPDRQLSDQMRRLISDFSEMFREQVEFRDLFWQMTKRDLLLRYKQTVMGFAWAIFMPLVNTLIFSTIFTRVAPIDVGMPYPLFAFSGLLAWNFFGSSLRFASTSLASNAALVSKVYFPREVFPVSQVVVCLFDTLIAGVVVVGLMTWYGYLPGLSVMWLPVVALVHILLTVAGAMILSMCNLFFRDVKYLTDVVLSVAMFSTTALYPADLLGGRVGVIVALNPISAVIDGYRSVLFFNRTPFTSSFALAAVVGLTLVLVSWLLFHRAEYKFAESV